MRELNSEGHEVRALLVDDDDMVRRAYGRILRKAGFQVDEAANGIAASTSLLSKSFDLVVTDVDLPGLNGIDVLRLAHQYDPDLPVVVITGSGELNTAMSAVEFGALRYLLKPVDPSLLSATAKDAVAIRELSIAKKRAFDLYGRAASDERARAELSSRFDRALETLHMNYQPIVCWSARTVFAHEALVRTEETSLLRPDQLLAAAEQLNRLHDVGRLIRQQVAETMRRSPAECVFVNLHPRDLEDDDLLSPESPLSKMAPSVVLEVTERASLEKVQDARARLATLRQIGFRLAVDDLGAGYAGLTSFAQLHPEVVKLDMALIRGVDREPTRHKLIESMIRLCRDLEILVVAEGVETVEERRALVEIGTDLMQGYFFARPAKTFPPVQFGDD